MQDPAVIHTWRYPRNICTCGTSPDGRFLVTGNKNGHLCVFSCDPPYDLLCDTIGWCGHITSLAVCYHPSNVDGSTDDLLIITGHVNWTVRCWRVDAQSGYDHISHEWSGKGVWDDVCGCCCSYAMALCISHDGKWVAAGVKTAHNQELCLFSLPCKPTETVRSPTRVCLGQSSKLRSILFFPGDRFLVSCHSLAVCVWSVETGEQLQYVKVGSPLQCMALRQYAGGTDIITCHDDASIRQWPMDLATGECMIDEKCSRFVEEHYGATTLCCTEDGKYVITGGEYANTMRILDIATGDQVMQFNHDSPDGTMTSQVCITYTGDIVTCRDCRACLWQLPPDTRRAILPLSCVCGSCETLLLEEQLSLQSALAWLAEQDNSSLQSHDESTPTPPLANVVIASIVLEDTRLRRRLQGVFT